MDFEMRSGLGIMRAKCGSGSRYGPRANRNRPVRRHVLDDSHRRLRLEAMKVMPIASAKWLVLAADPSKSEQPSVFPRQC